MTPAILDKIERLHDHGFSSQVIVESLGHAQGSDEAWWAQGATGYHDGVEHGMGGEGWTRANARAWNKGWTAAAKHAGLRKVVLADCGKDCDDCDEGVGDWHYMGCSKLAVSP